MIFADGGMIGMAVFVILVAVLLLAAMNDK